MQHLSESKLGTLTASTIAGIVGTILLLLVTRGNAEKNEVAAHH